MERAFATHRIRKATSLDGLWNLKVGNGTEMKMMVPGCIQNIPGYENYEGRMTYEKEVSVSRECGVNLVMKGVSHTADVFWDDVQTTHHYNAFTPFHTVIQNVKAGVHCLRVEVDCSYNEESALHVPNDYFTYGGITRPVVLEEIPDCFIENIHILTRKKEESWYINASVRIQNLGTVKEKTVRLKLEDKILEEEKITLGNGVNYWNVELAVGDVQAYSLQNPKLYYMSVILQGPSGDEDDLIERFGFREIKISGSDILLNGEKIRIKGFNRHEDHAQFGCAIPYEQMHYDIRLIRDMGGNAIRTSHYPNDERFLDLCDELGILVWEESHARGLSEEQMRHKNFRRQSLDCIDEMIDNHFNHPAIFTWGILNECASYTEYGREVYIEQFERIKQLDSSRPTTFASCHFKSDICLDLPDIVSMNIYPLWYHDTPAAEYVTEVYEWVQTTQGNGKPFIVSEIGAGAIPGYHAWGNPKWSEERQQFILGQQLKAVLEHEKITGVFIWQFSDCRVPDGGFYGRPRCMNNKGIVDENRNRKLAYETVKRIFSQGRD